MPILAREDDIYPHNLFTESQMPVDDAAWWALYTLSRQEKKLMRWLYERKIPFYAPLISRRQRSPSGRTRTSYVPLFPGYVFILGSEEERLKSLTSNCISRQIAVDDGNQLCEDLRRIKQLIETGAPLTVESRIEPGQLVRIRSGPFIGLEGVVVKRHRVARLIVMVHFMQQGASILLEDCDVEPI